MKPFSHDFRERIVSSYESDGLSYAEVGRRFSVSVKVVSKLVRQKRDLGTLAPPVNLRGRKPAISGEKEVQLRKHLEKHPDATVVERLEALGLECTEKTLRKMGWRFKKSRPGRRNKIASTSH